MSGNSARREGGSSPTAVSMRRRTIATISRSVPCCSVALRANPATWSRPAAAPASMWSISPVTCRTSCGGRAISTSHIAPGRVAEGLFAGAGRYLREDGRLLLYGPFKRDGKHTSVSNAVFDTSLRERDGEWGVRDIAELERLGRSARLA